MRKERGANFLRVSTHREPRVCRDFRRMRRERQSNIIHHVLFKRRKTTQDLSPHVLTSNLRAIVVIL